MVICNIQRGGPSTGLPTKTEQADLLQGLFGRNGECPIPVVAAQSPSHCFWAAIEAALAPAGEPDVLYFVTIGDESGRHAFASTLAEHERNIDRYLRRTRE